MTVRETATDILAAGPLEIGRDRAATILRTIRRGWRKALARTATRSGTAEVVLNEMLRDGMREAVEPRPRGRGPRMLVAGGTETRSTPDVLAPDGRTDIPLYFLSLLEELHIQEPHAIIECKRVSGNDTRLCREYVVSGIDRFVHGRYGARHAAGFMAGYVESGSVGRAVGGINGFLGRKDRRDEQLGPARGMGREWARGSRHPRTGGRAPMILHHAFLEFG